MILRTEMEEQSWFHRAKIGEVLPLEFHEQASPSM